MSRAVNKSVAEAVSESDPTAAYEAISKALTEYGGQVGELLEVEILGKSHPLEPGTFVLKDGNAIAVSKYGLVQAFFVAHKILQSHLSAQRTLSPVGLLAVTSVVLLMDPEHLSAANSRKRLVFSAGAESEASLLEAVERDRFFVDSLLTSRLHRHTKSPTLWSHRRWLVETAARHGVRHNVGESLEKVIMVAGQRHRRNYYAWCHARWLVNKMPEGKDGHDTAVLMEMLEPAKRWCFQNHTDTSGWSYLYFLLMKLDTATASSVFEETAKLAVSLRWTNESTWVFLRTLAASEMTGEEETALFRETRETLLQKTGDPEGGPSSRALVMAQTWFDANLRHT
jgi:protein prenyltransferase alpha subunit repeat containing protein 1